MPIDHHYTDAEVEAWIAEKYPMRGHRTGEMLRALLADRTALLAEVLAGRDAERWRVFPTQHRELDTARATTDVRLGAEVTG